MSELAAAEALRVVRSLKVTFSTGSSATGSAFFVSPGVLVTCAHVVVRDDGQIASRVVVSSLSGTSYDATVESFDLGCDLARLSTDEALDAPSLSEALPTSGHPVVFAGLPQGVTQLSVFSGMVSSAGPGLLPDLGVDLIQIGGMVNNGNSGGPLIDSETGEVMGVMTAKYVPLLMELDTLQQQLDGIPQFPTNVGLGGVDFAAFVNLTIRSMWQLARVLRLVQVGTGWAVPVQYFPRVEA